MAATTVEALIESFRHPIVPPYHPTHCGTPELPIHHRRHMTTERQPALGHLALTILPALYATLPATIFVPPNNPGTAPDNLALTGTAAQISAAIRHHKEAL